MAHQTHGFFDSGRRELKPFLLRRQVIMNPFAYATVILIWGTTPLGVQWSAEGLSPFIGALLRVLIALCILLSIIRLLGIALPFHIQARRIYSVAVLGQGLAMLMIYWASTYLPSGLVSLIFGFSPLITGLLAWYLYKERLSLLQVLAIALAMFGLLLAISQDLSRQASLINVHYIEALVIMLMACLFFCLSNIWIKRFSSEIDIHPLAMTAGSIMFSLPLYILCVLVDGLSVEDIHLTVKSAGSIMYLALFGSVLAPFCFYKVLKTTSASMMALITVVAPVIALILGALLNDEEVGMRVLVGAAFVLGSLLLFQYASYLPGRNVKLALHKGEKANAESAKLEKPVLPL